MKPDITLAICGHACHGKSTLLGKTVAECGMVSRHELEGFARLASQGPDPSFTYALLVFRHKNPGVGRESDEANTGVTILPSFVRFDLPDNRVTVVDTPGQETYTNNRFSGLYSADAALLVVDATEGPMPITHQVMRILKGYEIPVAGVVATKMDRVDYSQEKFDEVCATVRKAFDRFGIDHASTAFIPTSAYAPKRGLHDPGEGLTQFERIDWHEGPTLHELFGRLDPKLMRPTSPLRLVIHSSDVYDQVPGVGKAITGIVETGSITKDVEIIFEPVSTERGKPITGRIRSVELTRGHIATPGKPVTEAVPRQLVGAALRSLNVKDRLRDLFKGRGVVAGLVSDPPTVAREIEVEITIFEPEMMVQPGHQWTLHTHVDSVGVEVGAISATRAENATEWEEGESPGLVAGEWGRLRLIPVRPVAIEEAGKLAPLSKLVLRQDQRPFAYGRCVKVIR